MEEVAMATKTIVIKKYENRRLYDATNSRYINLEEVADFVRRGYEIRVLDVASGEDITRVILTQIIAEGAKTPDSSFPLDILRQMVIASGRVSQESALRYTKAMLDLYQSTYRAMAPALDPFDYLRDSSGVAGRPASGAVADSAPDAASSQAGANGRDLEEMDRLKKRVAELEKAISSIASRPKKRARQRSAISSKK
jgi:polyhydroxyalkanoate synthesis repressor PhaR